MDLFNIRKKDGEPKAGILELECEITNQNVEHTWEEIIIIYQYF